MLLPCSILLVILESRGIDKPDNTNFRIFTSVHQLTLCVLVRWAASTRTLQQAMDSLFKKKSYLKSRDSLLQMLWFEL